MKKQFLIFTPLILLASCTTQDRFEARLEETLVNNPQILTKIIEKNPDKFVIAFQNAVKQGQQKIVEQRKLNEEIELQKAIEHFQRVTELQPSDTEAYVNLGVLLVREKQFNKAEDVYQKSLELEPDSVEGQFNMGAFYEFHKENLEQAKMHYQKYLALGGTDNRIQELMKQ